MCGLAGFLDFSKSSSAQVGLSIAQSMAQHIHRRGPDDGGAWVDEDAGVALAHRRLSIIDLSQAGHQPMKSASGRYVIAYNGEVYNFTDIKTELETGGVAFNGHSDTEVLLEAIARWGVEKTLPRLIGMFAFAVWDRETRTLTLARDRLGIKPLYWGQHGQTILFASEPQCFFAHPNFKAEVDRQALTGLVGFNYVPGSGSIFQNVSKLEPGTIVVVGPDGNAVTSRYWDVVEVVRAGLRSPFMGSWDEAETELERLLSDSVQRRMVSDVPLGALLSGGVDSSVVAALMQQASTTPVKTFSIGFAEDDFNEATHAKAVADHLGTEHHELYVTGQDALDVIPNLSRMYAEPFADSSQIPTYLVSAMARQHVTVALSGDGGDEVFAGYNRYQAANGMWPKLSPLPLPLRQLAAGMIGCVPENAWGRAALMLPKSRRPPQLADKMTKFAQLMGARDLDAFYARVVKMWDEPASAVVGGAEVLSRAWQNGVNEAVSDPVQRMQVRDLMTYLPDDILTKVDRASMAVGLEARVPILDHRVVEFAWSLPKDMKLSAGETKRILRGVLYRHVPKDLIERPKMGFGIPLGEWLRGPLREWAENLLSEKALKDAGLFEPGVVRKKWQRHIAGATSEHHGLWSVLMAQDWHQTWMRGGHKA